MEHLVNLTALVLIVGLSFLTLRQGLLDLENGMWGTILFLMVVAVFLAYLARTIFYNIFDRRKSDSMARFLDHRSNARIRGRPDIVLKTVTWLGTLAWSGVIASVIALFEALDHPLGMKGFALDLSSLEVDSAWKNSAFAINLASAVVSGLGLLLKSRRSSRLGDRYPRSLVFPFLFSLAFFILLSR